MRLLSVLERFVISIFLIAQSTYCFVPRNDELGATVVLCAENKTRAPQAAESSIERRPQLIYFN